MSSAHELAMRLCEEVRRLRLERIGETVDDLHQSFTDLPPHEQQPWLDTAEVVLRMIDVREREPALRLHGLVDDWERYGYVLSKDPNWRDEMRRAVIVEMRAIIDRLWKAAGGG